MFNILAPNSKLLEKRSKITNNISCKKNFARELIISKRIIIVVKDWHATNHIIIRKITFAGSQQRYTIYDRDREFKFQKDIQPGWRTLVVIIDIAPLVVERHLHSVWIRLSMVSERERNNETERARLSTLAMLLMHKIIAILLHEKIYDIEFLRLRHPPLSLFSFPPSRTSNTRRCSCAQGCVRLPLSRTRV